jgi:hypothetical protein
VGGSFGVGGAHVVFYCLPWPLPVHALSVCATFLRIYITVWQIPLSDYHRRTRQKRDWRHVLSSTMAATNAATHTTSFPIFLGVALPPLDVSYVLFSSVWKPHAMQPQSLSSPLDLSYSHPCARITIALPSCLSEEKGLSSRIC